ncbi:MAG TPA: pentapeptide repeat-containing protein [Tepidisphaeraceae bacterium]|nr:pentapeptide repeat-containing protein [Tepidisphaeraceae bacterium]
MFIDWVAEWAAYGLSRLSLLELLEYCSSFSLLIAITIYFVETPQRTKVRHYQAWQVINSAQGKGGSGGRIEAMHELNEDHVSLLGVNVSDAFLQGIDLRDAILIRADLSSADMRNAELSGAHLESANMRYTNLSNADLSGADVGGAVLDDADLHGADLSGLKNWRQIATLQRAEISGVRNAPEGFVNWALKHGAVDSGSNPTTRE